MKRKQFWLVCFCLGLLGSLAFVLLIAVPVAMMEYRKRGPYPTVLLLNLDTIAAAQRWIVTICGYCWVFIVGGSFASFLNVVAWRLPQGRSVNGSSHCPTCNTKLSFWDNLPILGWLKVEGKCTHCRNAVSIRYFLAECLLGLVFAISFAQVLLSGGIHLPHRPATYVQGVAYLIQYPIWDLIQIWIYLLVLIGFLFTFTLIRVDRFSIPRKIFWTGLAIGCILPMIWPAMRLVPWKLENLTYRVTSTAELDFWITTILGTVVGGLTGLWVSICYSRINPAIPKSDLNPPFKSVDESVACWTLVGTFLGWQASIAIGMATILIVSLIRLAGCFVRTRLPTDQGMHTAHFFNNRIERTTENLSSYCFLATLFLLLVWNSWTFVPFWPDNWLPFVEFLVAITILVSFGLGQKKILQKLGAFETTTTDSES
ncbi:MAG: prepilin peptidase [Planctomycetota bacterium]